MSRRRHHFLFIGESRRSRRRRRRRSKRTNKDKKRVIGSVRTLTQSVDALNARLGRADARRTSAQYEVGSLQADPGNYTGTGIGRLTYVLDEPTMEPAVREADCLPARRRQRPGRCPGARVAPRSAPAHVFGLLRVEAGDLPGCKHVR
jgi:hypothetical protein